MNAKKTWLLALGATNVVVALAGLWLVDRHVAAVEDRTEKRIAALEAAREAPPPTPRTDGRREPPARGSDRGAGDRGGPEPKVAEQVAKLSDDVYDYYSEMKKDLYDLRQALTKVQAGLKRIQVALVKPGQPGGPWGLAAVGDTLPPETVEAYRRDAEAMGVHVSPGRVEVRGFLNLSPDRSYPIEFFVTRWPESGHETLVHVVGKWDVDASAGSDRLKGLVTALYKGLVAAGFQQGEPSGYLRPPEPGKRPVWVPPKGDVVYLGVRYRLHGATHLARATDWVIDPSASAVLPEDAFRFTGGVRMEDPNTGDEMLAAEASGKAVSVYQDQTTLVEIAVPSNVHDDYQYHFGRIPRPESIVVLGEPSAGLRLLGRFDRRAGSMTVTRVERNGATVPIREAPVLLAEESNASGEGDEKPAPDEGRAHRVVETRFEPVPDEGGAWRVVSKALESGSGWGGPTRIRVAVDGKPVVSTGSEPLYLDLVFSKDPIRPEGDGALPMEPIRFEEPPAMGTGLHGEDAPPPPPPPGPAMDGK